jgi:NTP pyrophosphatase (non-canonical NTP hydrolase)
MGYPTFGRTIADYTAEIRQNNVRKGFRPAGGGPGTNTFGDYIALAHSELSEALEAYRDHRLDDATKPSCGAHAATGIPCSQHGPAKPEGVGSELADEFIRLLDMADVFGIDLPFEVERKIAYNATRPYRHGGRTLDGAMQAPVTRNIR